MNYLKYKSYFLICTVILILVITSCDSPVGFTIPQPEHQPDLTSFPDAFRGIYLCDTDSVLVKVDHDIIYTEYTEVAHTPRQLIEEREDCTIVNDTLHMKGYEHCVKIEYTKGGYVNAIKVVRDTLFRITPFQKVRLHKGNLVLSQVTENDQWTIALLQLDEDRGIRYRAIVEESDLQKIEAITPLTKNSNFNQRYPDYKVTPKQVELDQLFEDPEIFVDCNYYTRVRVTQ